MRRTGRARSTGRWKLLSFISERAGGDVLTERWVLLQITDASHQTARAAGALQRTRCCAPLSRRNHLQIYPCCWSVINNLQTEVGRGGLEGREYAESHAVRSSLPASTHCATSAQSVRPSVRRVAAPSATAVRLSRSNSFRRSARARHSRCALRILITNKTN